MASDLIYREDAKDFARHAYHKGLNLVEYLDEVPTADVRPVVRGKWEVKSQKIRGYSIDFYKCSVCGNEPDEKYNFCPQCGADMREKAE
jgi:hypothetical protein